MGTGVNCVNVKTTEVYRLRRNMEEGAKADAQTRRQLRAFADGSSDHHHHRTSRVRNTITAHLPGAPKT